MKKKKTNLDIGTLMLTGIISIVLSFSLFMLAAIVTETDITMWDRTKAVPIFFILTGMLWWYLGSNESRKEVKKLRIVD